MDIKANLLNYSSNVGYFHEGLKERYTWPHDHMDAEFVSCNFAVSLSLSLYVSQITLFYLSALHVKTVFTWAEI